MSVIALTCLQVPTSPIKYAITAVVVSALLICISSESGMFYGERPVSFSDDDRGGTTATTRSMMMLRDFGTSPEETVFPAWLAMLTAGYVVYMMSTAMAVLEG
jgi:hypothetical protein